ncbi:chromosome segregation protein SMC [Aquiluna sp.]|nr:chromosome segregation protein SMC [Aquiluna sp.]
MSLSSLRISGFKSFGQKCYLVPSPGINCIVGPNGSGKSNIVDALAWVMGEQGPSSLRSSKMEDVIFAGTESALPLGRAEVTVNLDNSRGTLSSQYAEIALSRVLYRNGVSEYSINGEKCRLLDIQELLSDSGLGREMHSIVGQGQLDSVLKATPIDRRAFIEEAAGVLKYRRRREKTERKLEAMQSNLIRLQDLISEVKKNLRPLGRQAETAQQASEISAGIRSAKSQLFALQLEDLKQKLEAGSNEESKAKSEASLNQSQLDTSRGAVAEIESELNQNVNDSVRSRLFTLESVETSLRSARAIAAQKINLMSESPSGYQMQKFEEIQRGLEQVNRQIEEFSHLVKVAADAASATSNAKSVAFKQLEDFDSEAEAFRFHSEERNAARAKQEANKRALEESIAQTQEAIESQSEELQSLITRVEELEAERRESENGIQSPATNLRAKYEDSRKKEAEARARVDLARDELQELEKRRDFLAARHAAIGQMLENPDGAGNLIKAKVRGVERLFADQVKVEPGYEKAVAVALGSLANAVSASSLDAAIAAISHLRENDLGRAEMVVTGLVSQEPKDLGSQARPLLSVVEGPVELRKILSNFFVANDLHEAGRLLESLNNDEVVIVTKDGEYLSRNLVKGGSATEPSKVELIAERSQTSRQLASVSGEIELASEALTRLKDDQVTCSDEVTATLNELQKQDAESVKKAESFGRLTAQLQGADGERTRLESTISRLREKIEADSQELAAIRSKLEEVQPTSSAFDSGRRLRLLEQLETSRQAETDAQIELGAMKERLSAAEREEQTLRQRFQLAENGKAEWERKLESQGQQAKNSEKVLVAAGLLGPLLERLIAGARTDLRELEASRQQKATRLNELRNQVSGMESRALDLGQTAQESEMKVYQLKLQHQSLTEKIFDELSMTPSELVEEIAILDDKEPKTEDELRRAIKSSESRLAQLGAFNPLALEEFSALEERHKYLTEQLADLNSARADLKGIIKDLDEKMNTIFLAAFEDTKKAFEEIFPVLFPGGTGSISLTEPEEGQEAGVEVSVRPAGKRIERMSLLSGGERSLAAIALLIAIFKARPSPFYVLDEVEAALDDANLGRLLEVLETLRETSQLIIVTHQKRTMEIADALYGVSMGKDGITRVVGQKLDKAS